ncbi:MAG: dephospho-CoA kinase [Candidatus Merdivicinus sp.]|jgi:dephospho-CoA kinase
MADKPLVVGLTGQTGAGKTTVSEAFRKNGYAVINADLVAREVTADPHIVERLGDLFGPDIVTEEGTLNRKALAAKVFSDKQELLKLNTILYPIITKKIQEKIDRLAENGKHRILLDAPTLFESGAHKLCTRTVAVLADAERRKQRIMQRDHLTEQEALTRMSAQPSDSFYKSRASYLVRNDSSSDQLEKAVQPIIDRLEKTKNSSVRSMLTLTAAFAGCILVVWGFFLCAFWIQYPRKYQETVLQTAAEFEVSPSLVYGILKRESNFSPDFSEGGRQGIFPLTVEQFDAVCSRNQWQDSYEDLLNPEVSIRYGTAYLDLLMDTFSSERAILAAYFAGTEQTLEWLQDPEYSEDGVEFQNIPDDAIRKSITSVEGAQLMYEKLYKLD